MDEPVYSTDVQVFWGPAEQAAVERALSVPGLAERYLRNDVRRVSLARLSRTIEAEIIPRLMLAHRADAEARPAGPPKPSVSDIAALAALAIGRDPDAVLNRAEAFLASGQSLETVLLDLLAPTARLLGDMWRDDLCDFTDVTIGLARLQQTLRHLTRQLPSDAPVVAGRIALAPAPGDQHTLGLSIIETLFRKSGWDVAGGSACSRSELVDLVRSEPFDVVGLSISHDCLFAEARQLISAIRRVSLNRSIYVMVGGPYVIENPDCAAEVGADSASSDALDALRRAHSCVASPSRSG